MGNASILKEGHVLDLFPSIDRGGLVVDMEDALEKVVTAAVETGRKGTITIQLVIDPDTKSDAIRVSGEVKVTLPKKPHKASLFFATPNGNLVRNDPRQPYLPSMNQD